MNDFALFEARNRLFELIDRVEGGEEITITRRGKVVARLVPFGRTSAGDAVSKLKADREGVDLGRLASRDLIRDGLH